MYPRNIIQDIIREIYYPRKNQEVLTREILSQNSGNSHKDTKDTKIITKDQEKLAECFIGKRFLLSKIFYNILKVTRENHNPRNINLPPSDKTYTRNTKERNRALKSLHKYDLQTTKPRKVK